MAIYRGTGGSGSSSTDSYASEISDYAQIATDKAEEASDSASAAALSATQANDSATLSVDSATNADNAKLAAQAARDAAQTSEDNAGFSSDDAQKLAINPEDSQFTLSDGVTTGYSALHHKEKAIDAQASAESARDTALTYSDNALSYRNTTLGYRDAAEGHATTATTQAGIATTKASDAAASEASAGLSSSDAQKLAINAENSQFTLSDGSTTGYSALHYKEKALKAQISAEEARNDALDYKNAAEGHASTATTKASEAADSALSAAGSSSTAVLSANQAGSSAFFASNNASAAADSASEAAGSALSAAGSSSTAAVSASAAGGSAFAAGNSESAAATSETNAATSEFNAFTSASNASTSETNAATSASAAASSATAAETAETNAGTSETSAASSASNASTSETNAATSASAASTSETNAATSETNAATSESNAATSEANATAAYDNFDDRYLGSKPSDPALDNDGDALLTGALYFNSTDDVMKVYDGASWVAAYASVAGITLNDVTNDGSTTTNAITVGGLTSTGAVILNADPSSNLGAATKQYVDTIAAAGVHYHDPVRVEQEGNLTATYNNGSSGVGATLTNSSTQEALVIDGVTLLSGDRVLIYEQTNQAHNGIYTVTDVGSGSTNWVLTRAADADSYAPSDPDSFGQGDAFYVQEGSLGAGETYVMTTEGPITFGTTAIHFSQISSAQVYSGGTGIDITGTTISSTATLADVTTAGNSTTNSITVGGIASTGNVTASNLNTSDWDTAYGDKINTAAFNTGTLTLNRQDGGTVAVSLDGRYLQSFTETDPTVPSHVKSITTTNISNWNTAHGWGNHASAGYLTSSFNIATGASTSDPNTSTSAYFLTNHGNSPFGSVYSHIQNHWWSSNGGNVAQHATTYNGTGARFAVRHRYSGGWTPWAEALTTSNYTSYSPTLTGSGASGLWGISVAGSSGSCTGNADTATTASKAAVNTAGSGWYDILAHTSGIFYADTACHIHGDGYIQAAYFNHTHSVTTRNSDTQFYTGTSDNYIRANNATGTRASLNVPTRTGGDASGTWPINVGGEAARAKGLNRSDSASDSYNLQFRWAEDKGGYWSLKGYNNNTYHANCWVGWAGNADNVTGISRNVGDFGSISANTARGGYYGLSCNGHLVLMSNGSSHGIYDDVNNEWWMTFTENAGVTARYNGATRIATTSAGADVTGDLYVSGGIIGRVCVATTIAGANDAGSISIRGDTSKPAAMSFHRSGAYAVNFGLSTANKMELGGWSAGSIKHTWDMSGNYTAVGNVTAYSDIRLKDNIEVIPDAVSKVQQLRGVTFDRNDFVPDAETGVMPETRQAGVIAQEVQKVLPEVVTETDDGTLTVAYGNMVGLLIEAIKELKAEIDELKENK